MRRSEKISRFLYGHPRAGARELQKKFNLSYREAERQFAEHQDVFVDTGESSWTQRFQNSFRNIFRSEKKIICILLLLASLVRVAYVFVLLRHEELRFLLLDAKYYAEWATQIVTQGFLGDKIFFTEPLYAYLLALCTFLVGPTLLPFVAMGVQFLAGALFPVLLFFLGRRLFSRSIGLVAGLIAAIYGPFVFYDGLLLKTSFEVYCIPLFLFFFWRAFEKPRARSFVLLGMLLGVIALIKGNTLIFVPLTVYFIYRFLSTSAKGERLLFTGWFLIGVFVCVFPVTLRNMVVGHDFVPTNYSIGLVLYQGNWWGGDGSTALVPSFLRPDPKFEETDAVGMAESYAGHNLLPSAVSRFWMGKAISETLAAPGHFLATVWHKGLLLLNYREYSDNYSYAFYRSYAPFLWLLPGYFFLVTVGGAGLFLLFMRPFEDFLLSTQTMGVRESARSHFRQVRQVLVLFFGSYVVVLLATTINSRYRMPLSPFLILFAAALIVFCFERVRERTMEGVGRIGFVFGTLVVFAVLPLSIFKHLSFADAYNNIGYRYYEAGNFEQAKNYFNKAIADDPEYAWSYKNLAHIAFLEGQLNDGETTVKKLLAIRPDDLSNYEEVTLLKKLRTLPVEAVRPTVEQWLTDQEAAVTYDADYYEGS
ncbi:MAG: glycosyltransferase family 39 protein, partial [Candidatus Moranbacteria bacterium]|nr:glycosyltransferase family 39 protein [Candidatus Moranbacteria bacterium]